MAYRSRAARAAWRRIVFAAPTEGAILVTANPAARIAIGHNGGPPLDPETSWRGYVWRRKHKQAWKTPPREIALRRLARAEELGMTYKDYALEIMERGRYL